MGPLHLLEWLFTSVWHLLYNFGAIINSSVSFNLYSSPEYVDIILTFGRCGNNAREAVRLYCSFNLVVGRKVLWYCSETVHFDRDDVVNFYIFNC
jgi:hypothetical protein